MTGRKKQTDVSQPAKKPRRQGVTKAELRAELERFATREEIDAKFATKDDLAAVKDELKAEIAKCATKDEMAAQGTAIRAEMAAQGTAIRAEMAEGFVTMRAEMEEMLARHIGAAMEEVRGWFRALDDKYRDLPARVTALEERAEK